MISEDDKIHTKRNEYTVSLINPDKLGLENDVYLKDSMDNGNKRTTYLIVYEEKPFPARFCIEDISRRFFTCVELFRPKYYLHDIYQNTFSNEQKVLLNEILNGKAFPGSDSSPTNWQCLTYEWMTFSHMPYFMIPKNPPDYTLLPDK